MKKNLNKGNSLNKLKVEADDNIKLNKANIQNDFNSILYFLSYFKNNNEIMNNEWITWNKKFKNFSEGNIYEMKAILNELKKEGIYDYEENIKEKNNCFILFNKLNFQKEALDFLAEKKVEDIEIFYDIIDKIPSDFKTLKMLDIFNVADCVNFFQELKKINGGFKDIINHIKLKLSEKDLLSSFKDYLYIYPYLIELLNHKNLLPIHFFQEINSIITNSNFFF